MTEKATSRKGGSLFEFVDAEDTAQMVTKSLYRGIFNWSGESHEMFTHASSVDVAFKNFTAKLAKKLSLTRYVVAIRFLDNRADNYRIERIAK